MPLQASGDLHVQKSLVSEDAAPRITLAKHPDGETVELEGAVMEAEFSCGDVYVVITTEGCPYEEALHIYCVGQRMDIVDHLELSAAYAPAVLDQLSIAGPNEITFTFFSPSETWSLTVLDAPKFMFGRSAHAVKRRMGFARKSRLRLTKKSEL